MAYYDALIAEWATLSGTTEEKLASVNSATVPGPSRFVSRGELRQYFDNLVEANGVPVWEAIEAAKDGADTIGIACRAALRLRDAPGDYPPISVTAAVFSAQMAILVSAGILTQAQADGAAALATPPVNWCLANGYPYDAENARGNLSTIDLAAAGLS